MEPTVIALHEVGKTSRTESAQERKLRASSYTIFVDLPDNKRDMLLVHGYTGAYDYVSQKVATFVRSLEVRHPPRPLYGTWTPAPALEDGIEAPSTQTIEALKRRGYLTERTVEEEETFFVRLANMYHARALRAAPSYILMPTYDCNLRCAYCFQDHMRTNQAYRHLLQEMSEPTIERIFAGILDLEQHHDLPPADQYVRNITLFGGEPLLACNRHVIDRIIQKAMSLGKATFSAVSNATELEAYRDLLNARYIQTIQVTLDGPAHEHDQRRIYADKSGSFEKIASNITLALEQGVRINLRMNIDRINIQWLPQLATEIIHRGWDTYPLFSAYTAPIHASNTQTDRKTTFDSWSLDKALNRLREEYPVMAIIRRPDDSQKDRARRLIESQDNPRLHAQFCGAHASMYVIDPFANVYACWERTGDEKVRIGHFTAAGKYEVNSRVGALWRSRNVTTNKICRQCRYAMYCGGGCAVQAEGSRGDEHGMFTNYCDGYAARFRASVAEAYIAHIAHTSSTTIEDADCIR